MMKQIRIVTRILIGIVFIFSGFVKGIDPMGSAIKFSEYFEVFHITWLDQASLILAVVLSTAEFLIGISLLVGLRMKVTAWASLLFMIFFTAITLYSALYSPVSDCGCFGDAIKLTNWETFYKNIVLLVLAVVVFLLRKAYKPYSGQVIEWIVVSVFAASMAGISIHCINHLPVVDFRPYHVGSHIASKMIIPEGAPTDVNETKLYYSKNGEIKEFDITNFPTDTTWKFVDSKNKIIKKGYTPPIHDFSITNEDGLDITNEILDDAGYSVLLISFDLDKIHKQDWKKIMDIYHFTSQNGYRFYLLSGSGSQVNGTYKAQYSLPFQFYSTDVTTLKTIIRSNPGMVLLKDGVILAKWHVNDFPKADQLKGNLLSNVLTNSGNIIENKKIYLLLSALTIALIVLWFLRGKDIKS